ncbi:hypothetical protein HWD99_12995 [Microbacterium sp. C5A9]|uniref:hypothetical protein n=1 Tax=Microbacterium sp. C5A9 TaxID=2736663 RepID=UPI001F525110|nr:hypothetical protein [Microbacterium sp. C5A9]MCI1019546.1 hypothetical protein [Microbacterium sp. C5A9]
MQTLDTLALVGEVLSWIGLGIGLPLLLLGLLIGSIEGPWRSIEIAIIERDGSVFARWFAGGDFHERPLRRGEPVPPEAEWTVGVVSANDPARARVGEPPHFRRVLMTLGIVFASVGVIGLLISFLPLFV